ncbi:aminotransferase class V-fold PLP-dependent enzyme [Candidatus Arthromitus sp. SFB-rat-Yit]|uniref:aminotransferase class V-fold PLP-dependent enzyme n=1 Tax=Candidatus Arthromitus sp. SFB-rat-Yit TaxID=1041504 RepID=UPI000227A4FF|nr:SufS family cysteine desulfurase [Candidatus Arthromitus sp. SFB-rat-Yit]BAK81584.1 cysteine desulfurase, SufS family [Candidatus Arthromitus sp. SFB-rat-Yit]
MDISKIREDFPALLCRSDNGSPIIYFDNAATSLKPNCVIDAMKDIYINSFGNANRGSHIAAVRAASIMDETRNRVKDFIGAKHRKNIIFTKSATEALNIVVYSYAMNNLKKGDEILIGIDSHHSNLVPWKVICDNKGIKLNYFYVDKFGEITFEDFLEKLNEKPKIVSFTPVTNTFGVVHDYKTIIKKSKEIGAKVLIDASQSMTHIKFNVDYDGVDFLVFSGHKVLSPQGIGVLYASDDVIDDMNPFLYGGDMIDYVFEDEVSFKKFHEAFEGGTQNVSSIAGLNAAIKYIDSVGFEEIVRYENSLKKYFLDKAKECSDIEVYGPEDYDKRVCVFSFNVVGVHPHDVSTILDSYGIAVRSGNHCSQPFMRKMGLNSTTRASLYFYNTNEEIDYFFDKVSEIRKILKF